MTTRSYAEAMDREERQRLANLATSDQYIGPIAATAAAEWARNTFDNQLSAARRELVGKLVDCAECRTAPHGVCGPCVGVHT